MKAVILAGGYGTRMRPLTFSKPKPLIPILNKPITEHILDYLSLHGITEVAFTTNYLREQIEDYFGNRFKGIKLTYPVEEKPLGTAGCVKNIEDFFDDTFLIMQGDTVCDINLTSLIKQHKYFNGIATLAAHKVSDPWNFGVMELEDSGRIKGFHEKPLIDDCVSDLVNTGIYVLEPEALDFIPRDTFFDFSKDLFPILLDRQSLFGVHLEGFWADIGRPEGYIRAKNWLMTQIEHSIHETAEINGIVEGPVVIGENVVVGKHSHLIGPVYLGDGIKLDRGVVLGPNTVLGSNIRIRENTVLNGAILFENTKIGSDSDISTSFIAENCKIGSNGLIQSDVLIGGNCEFGVNCSIINGSRIWPNMDLQENSMVSGTIKRFIPGELEIHSPKYALRTLTKDEAFYFNKFEGKHVSYTGSRALSLWEFTKILKNIDNSSILHHIRNNQNDFRSWAETVLCDIELSNSFDLIKNHFRDERPEVFRHNLLNASTERLNDLIEKVKHTGYV